MTESKTKNVKKEKKKGPIRTGAIVPFIIFVVLVTVFGMFFLDNLLKKSMEYIGTNLNGAEVNIGEVITDFKNLDLEVKKVQVTDKENPEYNSFEIGLMSFSMMWDALLRAKVVIDLVEVKDVLILTKRQTKGFVLPPPPPEELAKRNKQLNKVLNAAEKEFDGNIFGDIAGVLSGSNKNLGDAVGADLESKQKIAKLKKEVTQREKKVSQTLKSLPDGNDFKNLEKRFNNIDWNGLSNIAKAPKILKEADQLKKDADKMIKAYEKANKEVNQHIQFMDQAKNKVPQYITDDVRAIEKKLKIPSIDTESIAKILFGNELLSKIDKAQTYQGKIKKYMPPKKEKKEEPIKPKRQIGMDYRFGTPNSYPAFWVKKVAVNSKNKQGTMQGQITDITNNQKQVNKPTLLNLKGDFPGQQIRDVEINGSLDRRDGVKDSFTAKIGQYPVKDKALSDTEDVKFIIRKANAKSIFNAKFFEKKVRFDLRNTFTQIDYDNSAKSPAMDSILKGVAASTQKITLNAKARGKWDKLKWDVRSNLAQAIQNTVKSQVQAKIDQTKKKIKADVEKQIQAEKDKLYQQINQAKAQYEKAMADGKKQLNKFKNQLKSKEKKAKKKAKKDAKKNLLKGISL